MGLSGYKTSREAIGYFGKGEALPLTEVLLQQTVGEARRECVGAGNHQGGVAGTRERAGVDGGDWLSGQALGQSGGLDLCSEAGVGSTQKRFGSVGFCLTVPHQQQLQLG